MGYWKDWARCAAIRAVKTFAQSACGMIAIGAGLHELNWVYILSVSATAAVLSVLTSIAGIPEVPKENYQDEEK